MTSLESLLHQIADPSELGWKDETYDLALAGGLSAAERSTFVARLIDAAGQGDQRAVLTLGHVQAVEALPMLRALARSADPAAAMARRALVQLGHGGEVADAIAHDAVHAPAKLARVAAVLDLPRIGGAAAIAALQQALADPDDAVRLLAWDGLVEVFALAPLIRNPDGVRELTTDLEILRVLLGSGLSAFVQMGSAGMRTMADHLQAGATPRSLGIAWSPNPAPGVFAALRVALFDPDAAFPVDDIARLTGAPRRLAETLIALRLEDQDPRVPEALVRLAATWTVPALEEVARSADTSPELRDALARSAGELKGA
jgi:hypothetical protein